MLGVDMLPDKPSHDRFDCLIFVGRFQPFHFGHAKVVQRALEISDYVLLLVGSANSARSARNPFTFEERSRMIVDAVVADCDSHVPVRGLVPSSRVIVKPLDDHLYNDAAWIEEVQRKVAETIASDLPVLDREARVGITGFSKDRSCYYLRIFPGYEAINVEPYPDRLDNLLEDDAQSHPLSATRIRERIYDHALYGGDDSTPLHELASAMPPTVRGHLERIWHTAPFQALLDDVRHIRDYKAAWANSPFPPTFTTVDAVVLNAGHVLMVRRNGSPGKGQLALPGGFIQSDETLLDACIRELTEETQIKLGTDALRAALASTHATTFDDPFRSDRGRTITHAFRVNLHEVELPAVAGGDDAAEALWVPLAQLRAEHTFEDHAHIIRTMMSMA